MRTRADIEAYLMRAGLSYREVEEGTFLVHDRATNDNFVLRIADDLVLLRVKVLDLAATVRREDLYRLLLELNATEMVHGAYGIADDAVVLTSMLRLGSLDYEELVATIDDFSLALTNHHERLAAFRKAA